MFNNFFASCFSPPPSALLSSSPLLCQSSSAILSSFECDDSDVLEAIAHLKRHTSTGHDEISAVMLKGCSVSISSRLACIFNTSFSTSQVPSDWKISRITPIFKAGDPCSVCNYRPISLLSLLGKLQERILHSTVMNFLSVNNAISPSQFGFRPGSSTHISMSQLWHQAMEAGGSTLCLFLDIAKAFDSLPHSMIIDALSNVGIAGSLLNWFVDYLSSRSQFVAIHGFSSPLRHVTSGVPQGSILGPLLFIVAFDGIFHLSLSSDSNMTGYADDVTYSKPLFSDNDIETAYADLDLICQWIGSHDFRLNLKKVKSMVISRKKLPPQPLLQICGEQIEFVSSFKLLGVIVTDNLSWTPHIMFSISKAKRLIGFLFRVFKEADEPFLSKLYKAIVLPHL